MATYPNGIASWTNRIDNVNTVWAADPNTLASELIAVEGAIGTNPQIESSPIAGNPITYTSMSARLSDTLSGRQLPYVTVSTQGSFDVRYGSALDGYGQFNVYTHSASDTWGWYNGSDITVGVSGIYVVDVEQDWEYSTSGYYKLALTINNINLRSQVWHWDFPSGSASNYSANFAGRQATMGFSTVREFVAGTRIRVVSENGTAKNPVTAENASLTLQYLRQATVGGAD